MGNRTYFYTEIERDANKENMSVPLQVNCTGEVTSTPFSTRNIRRDFYYIYVTRGQLVLALEQKKRDKTDEVNDNNTMDDLESFSWETLVLEPGDAIVIEPGRHYRYHSRGNTAYLWMHYTGSEAAKLTHTLYQGVEYDTDMEKDLDTDAEAVRYAEILALPISPQKLRLGLRVELEDCFERLFREFIMNDPASEEIKVCILREILALTVRFLTIGEQKLPLTAVEYIHRHFREELDVDTLAEMEYVSTTTFRLLFKKHTGRTPNEYIISQRLSEACRLLIETEESVRDIAARVGYGDPYYFSRIFHKKLGISPLKYRFYARVK